MLHVLESATCIGIQPIKCSAEWDFFHDFYITKSWLCNAQLCIAQLDNSDCPLRPWKERAYPEQLLLTTRSEK